MNVDQMRVRLLSAYPGEKWEKKVKKMSDNQVIAVHQRLQAQGKIK